MKRSRVVLAVALGAIVAVAGVSVVSIAAAGGEQKKTSPNAVAASVSGKKSEDRPHSMMLNGVDNIQASNAGTDKLTLSWDKAAGADGYCVYAGEKEKSAEFKLVADVKEPKAEITGLKDTTLYEFKVTAYNVKDGVTFESPSKTFETATLTGEVTGVEIMRSSEVLKFRWDANDKVTGYDIHRASKASGNKYEYYKTLDGKTPVFEDKNVKEGELYSYRILPFRTVNNVNYYAPEGKTVELISGLGAPADFVARSSNTRVTVSWKEKKLASGYHIYMAKGKKGKYKLLGSTDETTYTTDKLTAGETYYFRVQPYKTVNKKEVKGTWSTCSIKAAKAEESTRSAPKSSISGSGTYIEISIAQQHMWLYVNGKQYLDTDVVTGNNGSADTPTGNFSIESRAQDTTLTGEGYSSFVSYWMGFLGGYGIHDASWRSSFGGDIYSGDGSHGCVNTPYEKVKAIYEHTDYGTPVYIY